MCFSCLLCQQGFAKEDALNACHYEALAGRKIAKSVELDTTKKTINDNNHLPQATIRTFTIHFTTSRLHGHDTTSIITIVRASKDERVAASKLLRLTLLQLSGLSRHLLHLLSCTNAFVTRV